jgi:Fe-S-cluster containining protein
MNCNKYLKKCKAGCCGLVPVPKKLLQLFSIKVQEFPQETVVVDEHTVIHVTNDGRCPFLNRKSMRCAIYKSRPELCRKFGEERHAFLSCRYQHKDGSARKDQAGFDKMVEEGIERFRKASGIS